MTRLETSIPKLVCGLCRQFRPALESPRLEDRAAGARLHACPEAVLSLAASVVGLIRPFCHGQSPSRNSPPRAILLRRWSRKSGGAPECGRSIDDPRFSTSPACRGRDGRARGNLLDARPPPRGGLRPASGLRLETRTNGTSPQKYGRAARRAQASRRDVHTCG